MFRAASFGGQFALLVACHLYLLFFPYYLLIHLANKICSVLFCTSCLMLKFRCIKTVLLIDACLSLDHTLCVLYYFLMFYVFYSFLSSFTFHCNSLRLT